MYSVAFLKLKTKEFRFVLQGVCFCEMETRLLFGFLYCISEFVGLLFLLPFFGARVYQGIVVFLVFLDLYKLIRSFIVTKCPNFFGSISSNSFFSFKNAVGPFRPGTQGFNLHDIWVLLVEGPPSQDHRPAGVEVLCVEVVVELLEDVGEEVAVEVELVAGAQGVAQAGREHVTWRELIEN